MEENLKQKTVSSVAWSFVGTMSGKFIQFIITMVLARILSPSDYGLVGMISFFIAIAACFIDSGFTNALIRYKERTELDYNTVFYINLGMSIIMYAVLYVCAPFIADFYDQPLLKQIVRIHSIILIIGSIGAINSIRLVIELKFKLRNVIGIIASIVSGIVGIICAYYGLNVWSLIISQIVCSIILTSLYIYTERWYPQLIFSIESFKKLFGYGSKILGSNILNSAYTEMYPLVIGKQFNAADLAYVSRAQGMNEVAGGTMSGILASVAFPVLSRIQNDNEQLLRAYSRYLQISIFMIAPIVLFLCGVAKPTILIFLTEKWSPSIVLMQILASIQILNTISKININLLYVKGRSDLVFRLEVIKKSVAIIILVVSIFIGNLIVYCIGMVLYALIALYFDTTYTKKILNFGFSKQVKMIWPYIWRSILIMILALISSIVIDDSLLSLIVSVITCVPIYIYSCKYSKLYALKETIYMISPKLGRIGLKLQNWVE